jgi:hypothetical protein
MLNAVFCRVQFVEGTGKTQKYTPGVRAATQILWVPGVLVIVIFLVFLVGIPFVIDLTWESRPFARIAFIRASVS